MLSRLATLWEKGLAALLAELDLDEVLDSLALHRDEFLLDESVAALYVNRLAASGPELAASPRAAKALAELLAKYLELAPFCREALAAALAFAENPGLRARLAALDKNNEAPEALARLRRLILEGGQDKARLGLLDLLRRHPRNLAAASELLGLDFGRGTDASDWLPVFSCPAPVREAWNRRLFACLAGHGRTEQALRLWRELGEPREPVLLNLAAERFLAAGAKERGLALYRLSLELDPSQTPVTRRIAAVANPPEVRPGAADADRTVVNIYTWNKADMLAMTLASLRASGLGRAALRILLNGCRDDSATVAASARDLFPENDVTIVELPVNVGAPAARNWLVRQALEEGFERVAFLDDDVEVSPGWLDAFASCLEEHPKNGVVGCKIVFPGQPARLQYLYRNLFLLRDDLIRLTLPAPKAFDVGLYGVTRETASVMGCLHMFRAQALRDVPRFDLIYSPSQVDDIDHDLELAYAGWRIVYRGQTTCVHRQKTGGSKSPSAAANVVGNDVKFSLKHAGRLEALGALRDRTRRN